MLIPLVKIVLSRSIDLHVETTSRTRERAIGGVTTGLIGPEQQGDVTIMRDVFDFESPMGLLGRIADQLILQRYMKAFLVERNQRIGIAPR